MQQQVSKQEETHLWAYLCTVCILCIGTMSRYDLKDLRSQPWDESKAVELNIAWVQQDRREKVCGS